MNSIDGLSGFESIDISNLIPSYDHEYDQIFSGILPTNNEETRANLPQLRAQPLGTTHWLQTEITIDAMPDTASARHDLNEAQQREISYPATNQPDIPCTNTSQINQTTVTHGNTNTPIPQIYRNNFRLINGHLIESGPQNKPSTKVPHDSSVFISVSTLDTKQKNRPTRWKIHRFDASKNIVKQSISTSQTLNFPDSSLIWAKNSPAWSISHGNPAALKIYNGRPLCNDNLVSKKLRFFPYPGSSGREMATIESCISQLTSELPGFSADAFSYKQACPRGVHFFNCLAAVLPDLKNWGHSDQTILNLIAALAPAYYGDLALKILYENNGEISSGIICKPDQLYKVINWCADNFKAGEKTTLERFFDICQFELKFHSLRPPGYINFLSNRHLNGIYQPENVNGSIKAVRKYKNCNEFLQENFDKIISTGFDPLQILWIIQGSNYRRGITQLVDWGGTLITRGYASDAITYALSRSNNHCNYLTWWGEEDQTWFANNFRHGSHAALEHAIVTEIKETNLSRKKLEEIFQKYKT
ncbi:hypothetical protein QS306_13920 [Paraburkholderia bonniea]|uniref:hypothetical protein n=1 Tax=Paraburkholderia bonniea TaxID=2152891 RepID=UPI002573E0F4|nr:hypothetical protein [Paraburkholderia bonniea]WJF91871.1 hypothetical protein QS306_13920 [Paraburkholderia bonniea]WJF95190.1 hypothetical protein QS308_13930 [Paraburkholderia bonniea]